MGMKNASECVPNDTGDTRRIV